jgi:hypothetical protein
VELALEQASATEQVAHRHVQAVLLTIKTISTVKPSPVLIAEQTQLHFGEETTEETLFAMPVVSILNFIICIVQ